MNSTTSLIAKQYRLNQWAEQIRDCQNCLEGMTVTEWCSLHGITKDISVNGFCVHVTESTSPELLTRVLKVAAHVE